MSHSVTHFVFPFAFRRALAFAAILALAGFASCGEEQQQTKVNNDGDYPGIKTGALTAITGSCTFPGATSVSMDIVLDDGETALIQKGSDGTMTVNGYACDDGDSTPTTSTVKTLSITADSASTGNTVILDYSNGTYVLGTSNSAYGTFVSLDADGTNYLKIKGLSTSTADTITMGKATGGTYGINLGTDKYADITPAEIAEFVVSLGPGNDTFSAAGQSTATALANALDLPVTVYGGAGNDTFSQGATADTSGTGGETISGGEGTDVLDYSSRITTAVSVTVNAGTTNDGDQSGSGEKDDILDIDTIKGANCTTCNDTLTQDPALSTATIIYGYGGDDVITGGLGDDTLWGGAGDDTFLTLSTEDGNDLVHGEAGTDTMSYAGRSADLTVVMDGSTASGDVDAADEADKIYTDVENLIGGDGADDLTGNSSNNTISGGAGNDTITGGAGDDTFLETATCDGTTSGNDTYNGGAGLDTLSYDARTDHGVTVSINATTGSGCSTHTESDTVMCDVENLVGTDFVDTLTGHTGDTCTDDAYTQDNVISGGAEADTINGGAGDDIIDGEGGTDIIDCGGGVDICLDPDDCDADTCEM